MQYCNMIFLTLCLVGYKKIRNFTPEIKKDSNYGPERIHRLR